MVRLIGVKEIVDVPILRVSRLEFLLIVVLAHRTRFGHSSFDPTLGTRSFGILGRRRAYEDVIDTRNGGEMGPGMDLHCVLGVRAGLVLQEGLVEDHKMDNFLRHQVS